MKSWDEFDKFEGIIDTYMPDIGEGETMASQICTAVNKLVYKWYNDGDVFDNTYDLSGWANDLSSYANWLDKYTDCGYILRRITDFTTEGAYEDLLFDLAEHMLDENKLVRYAEEPKIGSIYDCDGWYTFK